VESHRFGFAQGELSGKAREVAHALGKETPRTAAQVSAQKTGANLGHKASKHRAARRFCHIGM
jgi:hypothetical protein